MASSIMPVPTIWLSAPSSSHGQNAGVGHGTASPVAAITTAKKISENGKPNRKRILVAPQVPSGAVNWRCIALRATWPRAATIVKGIQSVAMPSMWGSRVSLAEMAATVPMRPCAGNRQNCMRHRPRRRRCERSQGRQELGVPPSNSSSDPRRRHHVVHVHVGGDAPAVGERAVDHAGLLGDGELVVFKMMREFVGGDELVPLMGKIGR